VSITPASDILLDVAKAADPARSAEATARLAQLAENELPSDMQFSSLIDTRHREPSEIRIWSMPAPAPKMRHNQHVESPAEAVEGLERLLLQRLVESMLPREASTLFGRGTAGDVWRSMLSDQLAAQIASVVDLGITRAVPWLERDRSTDTVADRHIEAHKAAGWRTRVDS
jgi:flagellar protein FlgJ